MTLTMLNVISLFGQSDTIFYDKKWKEIDDISEASFYRLTTFDEKKELYLIEDFYISGAIQMKGYKKDLAEKKHEGEVIYYHKNGSISQTKIYKEGKAVGKWKSYSKKGKIKIEKTYKNGAFIEGTNYTKKKAIKFYILRKLPCWKSCKTIAKSEEQNKCTINKIQEYCAKIKYPQKLIDKGVEGRVLLSFIIEKNGAVRKVNIRESSNNKVLDKTAIRHLKKTPKLIPAEQYGVLKKVMYNIPISFKID